MPDQPILPNPTNPIIELDDVQNATAITDLVKTDTNVSAKDIFRFAKWILGVAFALFSVLALIRMFGIGNLEASKEVWDFTKVAINSIISIVIGFYFGNRKLEKS
jgi:hypothetical protein